MALAMAKRMGHPAPGSLFRPLHGSAGLHQGYGSGFDFSSLVGYSNLPVPGRLTSPGPIMGAGAPGSGGGSQSLPRSGYYHQPGQVQSGSSPAGSVSQDHLRLCDFQGFSFLTESGEAALARRRIPVLQEAARVLLEGSVGDSLLPVPACSWQSS